MSQKRKGKRSQETGVDQDRMEKENQEFQQKVREGYLYQAKQNPQRWLVLDGTATPESLHEQTLEEFKRRQWLD